MQILYAIWKMVSNGNTNPGTLNEITETHLQCTIDNNIVLNRIQ